MHGAPLNQYSKFSDSGFLQTFLFSSATDVSSPVSYSFYATVYPHLPAQWLMQENFKSWINLLLLVAETWSDTWLSLPVFSFDQVPIYRSFAPWLVCYGQNMSILSERSVLLGSYICSFFPKQRRRTSVELFSAHLRPAVSESTKVKPLLQKEKGNLEINTWPDSTRYVQNVEQAHRSPGIGSSGVSSSCRSLSTSIK